MARVAVVTDSTADLPADMIARYDIRVVPLTVRIDGDIYEDRVNITPAEFMRRLEMTSVPPTSSQPPASRFQQLYGELAATHDAVVSIHLSSRLSGTYRTAQQARDSIDGRLPIAVIDSRSASMGLGFPVLRAAEVAATGAPIEAVTAAAEAAIEVTQTLFMVDTLEYLRRGGRIGRAAEILGTILQLKPILRLEEGVVVPCARTRTRARATAGLIDLVREFPRIEQLAFLSTTAPEDLEYLAGALADRCPREKMIFSDISPALAAQLGPGAIGVVVYEGVGAAASPAAVEGPA